MSKDLFVPLKSEYYEAFKNGSKTEELRLYGARWNENTCRIGRGVILSKGYGKANRMKGVITHFKKQRADTFGSTYKADIINVYGSLDRDMSCIRIEELKVIND